MFMAIVVFFPRAASHEEVHIKKIMPKNARARVEKSRLARKLLEACRTMNDDKH